MAKKYKLEKLSINSFFIGKPLQRNSGQMSLRGFESGTGTDADTIPPTLNMVPHLGDPLYKPYQENLNNGDFQQWMEDHPINLDGRPNLHLVLPQVDGNIVIYPHNEAPELTKPEQVAKPEQKDCPPPVAYLGEIGIGVEVGTGIGWGDVGDVGYWQYWEGDGGDEGDEGDEGIGSDAACESVYYACPTDGVEDNNYDPDSWVLCDSDFNICENPDPDPGNYLYT